MASAPAPDGARPGGLRVRSAYNSCRGRDKDCTRWHRGGGVAAAAGAGCSRVLGLPGAPCRGGEGKELTGCPQGRRGPMGRDNRRRGWTGGCGGPSARGFRLHRYPGLRPGLCCCGLLGRKRSGPRQFRIRIRKPCIRPLFPVPPTATPPVRPCGDFVHVYESVAARGVGAGEAHGRRRPAGRMPAGRPTAGCRRHGGCRDPGLTAAAPLGSLAPRIGVRQVPGRNWPPAAGRDRKRVADLRAKAGGNPCCARNRLSEVTKSG